MRASIIASALFGALCTAKQSPVGSNATEVAELFAELAELPSCAVSIHRRLTQNRQYGSYYQG